MSARPPPQRCQPASVCLSSLRILALTEMNTMKNLWWRIVGEAVAVLWGIECWWKDRPIRRCPVCDEWHPRRATIPPRAIPTKRGVPCSVGCTLIPTLALKCCGACAACLSSPSTSRKTSGCRTLPRAQTRWRFSGGSRFQAGWRRGFQKRLARRIRAARMRIQVGSRKKDVL
jgi:hypothetical protein